MRIPTITAILAAALLSSASAQNGTFSVFLDDGSNAPGSTNTASPFATGDRDTTWNIMATAETGLAGFGAAAMQVRMVTFNINANSRGHHQGEGNGLAVQTTNNDWFDSSTGQAAAFQFTFFSDTAMTNALTGLNIRFDGFTSRIAPAAIRQDLNAYAGSGALVYAAASPENDGLVSLGGTNMTLANDGTLANLGSSTFMGVDTAGAGSTQYYSVTSTEINFSEQDTFWVRRRNETNPNVSNAEYQLGELTFTVVPEPGSFAAIFGVMALSVVALRRRAR